ISLFYKCLEINKNSDATMYEVGGINQILKNYNTAIKYSKKAVEIAPENKWYNMQLANLYIKTKKYYSAVETYKKLLESNKNDFNLYYNLAALYNTLEQNNDAIEVYNSIEEKFGVSEAVSLTKNQLFLKLGKRESAYNELKKLNKLYPKKPKYYGLLAEMYTNDNKFEKAKKLYAQLFDIDKDNNLGLLSEIILYRKMNDYDTFFKKVNSIVLNEDIPTDSKILIFLSILNNRKEVSENIEQIKASITNLVLKYPFNSDVRTIYADYLIKVKDFEQALIELDFVIENSDARLPVWDQVLSLNSYLGNTEKTYSLSKTAVDSFPQEPKMYYFAGISALQLEKNDETIKYLEEGLFKINDDERLKLEFYTYLGEAYHNISNHKKSDKYFEKVIEIDPQNKYVINNYSYYLSLREVNLERAAELSKRTIVLEPYNATYLDTYAWILFKAKKYEKALQYMKLAIKNSENTSFTLYHHYGDILYKNNLISDAIYFWKKAKEKGDTSAKLSYKIENKKFRK
ncbi:MAG: tetratricopeptide repeat protein, partial [Bacteroidota bacterium]|nr:tetratricopeptide repeat protein [Bacteroidota bacterium]